ncbi:MAG: hypothetical protein IPJ68_06020 [Candidatus Moraniibacteriota bacterium]|nr:MAG: hypothetical protein IPJ68_06020 [Candidatus Moranbacteria bacterium]
MSFYHMTVSHQDLPDLGIIPAANEAVLGEKTKSPLGYNPNGLFLYS